MAEKLFISQAIVVEGKYDKIKLSSIVDALIVPVDGFRVYKDKALRAFLKDLAESCGIIILTDSDAAGFRIRHFISDIAAKGAVYQVYIPDIYGKEKRKEKFSAEGKLGVEGLSSGEIYDAFNRAGIFLSGETTPPRQVVTRQDFYEDGLIGGGNSASLRRALCDILNLPSRLSSSALLDVVARTVDKKDYLAAVEKIIPPE